MFPMVKKTISCVLYMTKTAGSLFFPRNFSRDYEARRVRFSLKWNGTRHGRGTHEKKKQTTNSSHVFEGTRLVRIIKFTTGTLSSLVIINMTLRNSVIIRVYMEI